MIRFATIGTNFIVDRLLAAASHCPELVYEAVYSRKEETGRAFAEKYSVRKVYTSLDTLAADPDVDAVYIASPNLFHAEQAIRMLKAGKHVLCEKPIAIDMEELKKMEQAARENNVVLMEAMRSAYTPSVPKLKELMQEIGPVRRATLQFCQYSSRYDRFKAGTVENAFDPTLGNGALMDIGVYCVHFMEQLFSMPKALQAACTFLPGSIDGQGTILAQYDSLLCELQYSKITQAVSPSVIQCEQGSLRFENISGALSEITLVPRKGEEKIYSLVLPEGGDMVCELRAFIKQVEENRIDEDQWQHTLNATRIMDWARELMGVDFTANH